MKSKRTQAKRSTTSARSGRAKRRPPKRKKKRKPTRFLHINIGVYRCTVLLTWETSVAEIVRHSERRGVKAIDDDWKKAAKKAAQEMMDDSKGFCMEIGDGPDVVMWLEHRPTNASTYGTLYHEIYHAVDHLSESHSLEKEWEARAYLYEYLATACNRYLWK